MIIGITGTLGAGEGTVEEYLKIKGFTHYSARVVWNEEIDRRGLERNRDNMVVVANDLRAKHGSNFFAQRGLEKAKEHGGDVVLESIRTLGEADYIKAHGGVVWATDADVRERYKRIAARQSETDRVSFEKFVADEEKEMQNTDPAKQNIAAVMAMADTVLRNDGNQAELFRQVDSALAQTGV